MRYIVISAEYLEPSVTDAAVEFSGVEGLGISDSLLAQIQAWNSEYQRFIPATDEHRLLQRSEVERLDAVGVSLAARIAVELCPAKVRYYSEGQAQYLS